MGACASAMLVWQNRHGFRYHPTLGALPWELLTEVRGKSTHSWLRRGSSVSDPGTKPDILLYMRYRVTRLCSPPLVPHVAGMSPDKALLLRPLRLHSTLLICYQPQHVTIQQPEGVPITTLVVCIRSNKHVV